MAVPIIEPVVLPLELTVPFSVLRQEIESVITVLEVVRSSAYPADISRGMHCLGPGRREITSNVLSVLTKLLIFTLKMN